MLRTQNLVVGHAKKGLLSGIQAQMKRGDLICLIGPNGAGKSTLLKTLAGVLQPIAGTIQWMGEELRNITPQQKAQRLALILTNRIEAGYLTGRELVALGRYPFTGWSGQLSATDQEQVENAILATGATHIADRRLMELSDGERQRLMVARALAQQTPMILADEPTAFLDFTGKAALFKWMRNWTQQQEKAVLLTTHDLHLAYAFADRFWLITPNGTFSDLPPKQMVLSDAWKTTFPEWEAIL
ncbi:MAG: ABC transporter ATP-binding protein [Rhodothermia bacterium]|nr:ABC transporter ATP-binding protein [Rhodothermia bacterium]